MLGDWEVAAHITELLQGLHATAAHGEAAELHQSSPGTKYQAPKGGHSIPQTPAQAGPGGPRISLGTAQNQMLLPSAVLPTSCALVSSDVSGDLPVPQKQLHVDILALKDWDGHHADPPLSFQKTM